MNVRKFIIYINLVYLCIVVSNASKKKQNKVNLNGNRKPQRKLKSSPINERKEEILDENKYERSQNQTQMASTDVSSNKSKIKDNSLVIRRSNRLRNIPPTNLNLPSSKKRVRTPQKENVPNSKRQKIVDNRSNHEMVPLEKPTGGPAKKSDERKIETLNKGGQNKDTDRSNCTKEKSKIHIDENHENNETKSKVDNQIALLDFKIGDVIWAKLSGHPIWPSKIERIYGIKHQMLEIVWFNDYRRSKIYKTQAQNFQKHAHLFNTHIGLETAAKEAMIYIGSKMNKTF